MDIVSRVRNILIAPKSEWPVIAREVTSIKAIYRNYIVILAAIRPIAYFVGTSVLDLGNARFGLFDGMMFAIVTYIFWFIGVYVVASFIDWLATGSSGTGKLLDAFKLTAYSLTPIWLAGLLSIIAHPASFFIEGVCSLYSIYLLYTGFPVLMRGSASK
jgi:Yip1 domain